MSTPESLYCFKCKKAQGVKEVARVTETHKSKHGKDMSRDAWKGKCGTCDSNIRSYAKKIAPVSDAPAAPPVAPVVPEAPGV